MQATETAVRGITPAEAAKFESLFMLLDAEGSGGINEEELADLMPRMGVFLSEEELHQYFASVDSDGSGEIDFQEFLQLMAAHREGNQLSLLKGTSSYEQLLATTRMKNVITSDAVCSYVFDVIVLVTSLFWFGIVTFENVRHNNEQYDYAKPVAAVIYLLDVIRGFGTSRSLTDSIPVDDLGHTFRTYTRTKRFGCDLVAALPFDLVFMWIGMRVAMRVAQHLRLAKLFVTPSLFQLSPSETISPRYARFHYVFVPVLYLFFSAGTMVHMLAVGWLFLVGDRSTYIEAVYFVTYTLTSTGQGDIEVRGTTEQLFAVIMFICTSLATGLVVGKLVQFSQQADLETDANRQMLETLAALNHLTIPQDFKEEVLAFQLHRLRHSNSLFNEAISGLPQVMQERMALYARMKIVRQVPIFAEAQEICVAKLAQSLVNVFVPPEEYIVIAGEEGEEMFFLFHGMCGVTLPDGKWAATIKRGGVFGEVALLQETRRSASIKSLTYCQLFRLDKTSFESIVKQFPSFLESICETVLQQNRTPVTSHVREVAVRMASTAAPALHLPVVSFEAEEDGFCSKRGSMCSTSLSLSMSMRRGSRMSARDEGPRGRLRKTLDDPVATKVRSLEELADKAIVALAEKLLQIEVEIPPPLAAHVNRCREALAVEGGS